MATQVIDEARVTRLNDLESNRGKYTLYLMQQSQRAECNHALEFAIQRANETESRLLVCFGLCEDYPEANARHFHFMLEGLQETCNALRRRNIPLVVRRGDPAAVAIELARDATEVVCDRGYLRHQQEWRKQIATDCDRRVWQVESDAIVPVMVASDKQEYAARTIRSQLNEAARGFLTQLAPTPIDKHSTNLRVSGMDISDIDQVLQNLSIDRSVGPVKGYSGGTTAARHGLKRFLANSLNSYSDRGSILDGNVSHLSPYLHFGQISPLAIALEIKSSRGHEVEQKDAFLEELLVRRELAINFVTFNSNYDNLKCLPDWAKETLQAHKDDEREHVYTASELEDGRTHDPAWNAAMLEMKHTGYLHNHLRMYWGKKIIQWTNTPNYAHRVALKLNNRYFLDGRDANSYANVAWLFGLHDRAHQERAIFGKVRYMSAGGLRRKFDVDQYIQSVSETLGVDIEGAPHDEL